MENKSIKLVGGAGVLALILATAGFWLIMDTETPEQKKSKQNSKATQ